MQITNIYEAKSHLSKLVDLAFNGEDVIICKAGKPMVKLVRYEKDTIDRTPGYWEGKIKISSDFDQLPDSLLRMFKGTKNEDPS